MSSEQGPFCASSALPPRAVYHGLSREVSACNNLSYIIKLKALSAYTQLYACREEGNGIQHHADNHISSSSHICSGDDRNEAGSGEAGVSRYENRTFPALSCHSCYMAF